ncbi:hypothetical protein HMPREF9080_00399 [Cardiobacterium valvarum F0432]|uniref:Uncharacterized protein n=1 Tax=Cardiobacterium valvarum F0432 TaxID=797473 RepID=G9ZCC2_9GAMM|nr:hypothetical protein HMPREF9080_00399 [Cardiobacterium valvarum F0432]
MKSLHAACPMLTARYPEKCSGYSTHIILKHKGILHEHFLQKF